MAENEWKETRGMGLNPIIPRMQANCCKRDADVYGAKCKRHIESDASTTENVFFWRQNLDPPLLLTEPE